VDIAEAALAKAGIMAAIGKTAVTKARAAAGKAPAVELTAAVKAAETAATVETAEAATAEPECADLLGPDRNARGDGRARQQRGEQPISTRKLPDHPISSRRYFEAVTVANGIFSMPGGNSGVNTA
jgi:hypothetical protein